MPEVPLFKVFRPLGDGDFGYTEFQLPLTELVHNFLIEVESASLPAPREATVAHEIKNLLHNLDLASGRYDYWPTGTLSAAWISVASVPLDEGDSPPALNFRTRIEAFTALNYSDNPELVRDVARASAITSRKGIESARKVPDGQAAILGVQGRRVKRYPPRYEYEGERIDRGLRLALGEVVLAAEQVEFEATTSVDIWPYGVDISATDVFWLKTAQRHMIDSEPIVSVDAQLSHFRVLNELVARAQDSG